MKEWRKQRNLKSLESQRGGEREKEKEKAMNNNEMNRGKDIKGGLFGATFLSGF